MKIKIGNKTFEQLHFKGRALRNMLEIQGLLEAREEEQSFKIEDLDMITEFLVNVFDGQFTSDDLLDNLEFYEIVGYFRQVAQEIMKKTNDKIGKVIKK